MISHMVEDAKNLGMDHIMKVSFEMEWSRVADTMFASQEYTKENLQQEIFMVKEHSAIQMGVSTKENG
jgi:hypothetical protein